MLTTSPNSAILIRATVAMAVAGIGVPKHPGAQAPLSDSGFFVLAVSLWAGCAGREKSLPDPGLGTPTSHGLPSIIGVVVGRWPICPGGCHA